MALVDFPVVVLVEQEHFDDGKIVDGIVIGTSAENKRFLPVFSSPAAAAQYAKEETIPKATPWQIESRLAFENLLEAQESHGVSMVGLNVSRHEGLIIPLSQFRQSLCATGGRRRRIPRHQSARTEGVQP